MQAPMHWPKWVYLIIVITNKIKKQIQNIGKASWQMDSLCSHVVCFNYNKIWQDWEWHSNVNISLQCASCNKEKMKIPKKYSMVTS